MQGHVKQIKIYRLDFSEREMEEHVKLLKNAQPINTDQHKFRDDQLNTCMTLQQS